jgi:hypothetical protein
MQCLSTVGYHSLDQLETFTLHRGQQGGEISDHFCDFNMMYIVDNPLTLDQLYNMVTISTFLVQLLMSDDKYFHYSLKV